MVKVVVPQQMITIHNHPAMRAPMAGRHSATRAKRATWCYPKKTGVHDNAFVC